MKRNVEDELWRRLVAVQHTYGYQAISTRAVINTMQAEGLFASVKQAHRTLEKWSRKGWYEWGVCIDMGWPEIEARAAESVVESETGGAT